MKSEAEIIQFIDSKEALTQSELAIFIYGYKWHSPLIKKWWIYILDTKDWKKLRDYQKEKITYHSNPLIERKNKIIELIKNDKRLLEAGGKRGIKLLKQLYNISVSVASYKRYKKRIKLTA